MPVTYEVHHVLRCDWANCPASLRLAGGKQVDAFRTARTKGWTVTWDRRHIAKGHEARHVRCPIHAYNYVDGRGR